MYDTPFKLKVVFISLVATIMIIDCYRLANQVSENYNSQLAVPLFVLLFMLIEILNAIGIYGVVRNSTLSVLTYVCMNMVLQLARMLVIHHYRQSFREFMIYVCQIMICSMAFAIIYLSVDLRKSYTPQKRQRERRSLKQEL